MKKQWFAISVMLILVACETQKLHPNWLGGAITKAGNYEITQTNQIITVFYDKEGFVNYFLTDDSNRLIDPINKPSKYHRWMLYWDSQERLWCFSGDIGTSVWIKNKEETYRHYDLVSRKDLISEMPVEVFEYLPDILKGKWKEYRD